MLTDKQLDRYADVLLWGLKTARTGRTKKSDVVLIRYSWPAVRLAEILYQKLLEMGRNPVQRAIQTIAMEKAFYTLSGNRQLTFRGPGDEELFSRLNGSIFLHAPESITHLRDVDSKRIAKVAIARKYLRDILDKREEKGEFSWTLCVYPTEELAIHAHLSMEEYTNQIVKACFLNKVDPVAHWETIYKQATAIKKWLNSFKIDRLHIESSQVDLEIKVGEKRRWIGISGHNIPSFEIFLSPDCRGTRGVYFANQPSYRSGNFVKNIKIEFINGIAKKVASEEGQEFLQKQLTMDAGAAKIGEFSLTDKRFSKIDTYMANTLFDENYGGPNGNCHIALGASYSDTFDGNPAQLTPAIKKKLGFNDSALHWDIINTEKKTVTAKLISGKTLIIYENGQFTY